jgi:hypothetical protein
MADGMVERGVWRHNGEVIDGNELWAYGDDAPGYITSARKRVPGRQVLAGDRVNGELLGRGCSDDERRRGCAGN